MKQQAALLDDASFVATIEEATGRRPQGLSPLTGGCIAEIYKVELDGGGALVAKRARPGGLGAGPDGGLGIEDFMLDYLKAHSDLPVPAVLHCTEELLLLEYIETAGPLTAQAQGHAAELLAGLHGISAENFGFECGTVIGPLSQPNPWTPHWLDFFRDQRLLAMGNCALEVNKLTRTTFVRLEKLCARLSDYIEEPAAPALIHGDAWSGNILVRDGRIVAFIDPAIYYGDPEIELAFSTLFSTFGQDFFNRYQEIRPIAPGFFEARRDIYNIYPLLVHTVLFGGHYANEVHRIVARYA